MGQKLTPRHEKAGVLFLIDVQGNGCCQYDQQAAFHQRQHVLCLRRHLANEAIDRQYYFCVSVVTHHG